MDANVIYISPDPTRSFFERTAATVAKEFGITQGQAKDGFVMSPQTVLIGNKLVPNQTTYTFNPRNNVGQSWDTDLRLDQNDYFAVQAIGLKFSRTTYASATGAYSNFGCWPKLTFNDANYFLGVPASGLPEWQCLQTIVNGKYSFTVGSQQIIPQDSCQKLVYNPQSRNSATSPIALPQYNGLMDPASRGNYNLPMNFIIDLNQDNVFNIVLAPGDTADIDGATGAAAAATLLRNFLWVEMEGIVIKNMGGNRKGTLVC